MPQEWIGRIIVVTLSIALFAATELFFPLVRLPDQQPSNRSASGA